MTRPAGRRRLLAAAGVGVALVLGFAPPALSTEKGGPETRSTASPGTAEGDPAPGSTATTAMTVPSPSSATSTTSTIPSEDVELHPPSEDKPGLFDVGGRMRKGINDWFRGLVADALEPVLDLVARSVFATPDISAPGRARDLWMVSMGVANSVFVLAIIVGGIVLMGNETVQSSYTLKEILPRIVIGWIGANLSLWAVGEMIRLTNATSRAFLGSAETDRATAAEGLKTLTLEPFGENGALPVTLLLLVVVVLAVGIVATYVVRVANIVVLTVAAPLLIAAYATPRGEGAARLWWRAMCGCLLVQVGQSLMLASALRVLFDSDGQRALGIPGGALMDVTVVGCLFWGMLQLPTYAGRLIFAPRPTSVARYYVMGRGVRRAVGAGR